MNTPSRIKPFAGSAFWQRFDGPFSGVLTWRNFDALWQVMAQSRHGWFCFDLEGEAPTIPSNPQQFLQTLEAASTLLTPARKQSYCGAVYVDDAAAPTFVKVFDPHKMGSACGCSGERILPRFVFSKMQPDDLPAAEPAKKPSLMARLTGRG